MFESYIARKKWMYILEDLIGLKLKRVYYFGYFDNVVDRTTRISFDYIEEGSIIFEFANGRIIELFEDDGGIEIDEIQNMIDSNDNDVHCVDLIRNHNWQISDYQIKQVDFLDAQGPICLTKNCSIVSLDLF